MSYDLFADADAKAPAPDTIERLFIGLMLPHGLKGKAIRKDRLHVTLIHVGDYANRLPPSVVSDVSKAAGALTPAAFDVVFDRVSSFSGAPERHPHVLLGDEGVQALKAFRADLLTSVVRHGVKPLSRQDFNPHVTLSYADRRLPERPIRTISWRPDEFLLIHSEVGRSIYHTLGRWPLR